MSAQTIPLNLQRLRAAKGLDQGELAARAGISRLAYRRIEKGEAEPRVSTLQNIADALGVKLHELLAPVRPMTAVRFRARRRMTSRDQTLADVSRWLDDFNFLEEILRDKRPYLLRTVGDQSREHPPGPERARAVAKAARGAMGLDEREPIRDVCGLLEHNGIKIYPIKLASQEFFGLSVAESDGGPAVVVNVWERIPVERWIFSAAHELGHLLLHPGAYRVEATAEDREEENEADLFASFFLMPEAVFDDEWNETIGQPLVARVLKVKRIFRVSYKTVLYRVSDRTRGNIWQRFQVEHRARTGRTLLLADEAEAIGPDSLRREMWEARSAQEPDGLSEYDFVEDRLSELVKLALDREEITMSRGAEILGLGLEDMRERAASWVE